jgi:potassium efflux system protein
LAGAAAIADLTDDVDLAAVTMQTRKLVGILFLLVGAIGFWIVWNDVIPALTMLKQYPAWPGATLTVADLLTALLVAVATFAATRNVSGLLELTLLNYLPVDRGARYATTSLCRYGVLAIGVVMTARILGIQWSSVQWLVAAMGIGLGFGLQEIFANFVSGVLLLFERPIRVGDVVTLGETTGVVTRIRIRATTITDWDRKEYIVPNKDLVTGRLLNWTLSDLTNRVVIRVGIAYGSDVAKARATLLKIATEHPLILKDPAPTATFDGFGDSCLNMTLRCWLPDLEHRLPTIHDLHAAIHQHFQAEGIQIPFPQRELHVRYDERIEEPTNGAVRAPTYAAHAAAG